MTASELHRVEAAYETAARRYETAREARNTTIRQAVADGWTHAQIAETTGLTRSRIGQIAPNRRRT